MLFGTLRKTKATAEAALKAGDVEKAIFNFEKFLKKTPKDLRVLKQLGDLHRAQKDFPKTIEVYFQLALATHEQGLFLRSLSACRLVLEIDEQHVGALEILQELQKERAATQGIATAEGLQQVLETELEIDSELIVEETSTFYDAASEFDGILEFEEAGASVKLAPEENKDETSFAGLADENESESELDLSEVSFASLADKNENESGSELDLSEVSFAGLADENESESELDLSEVSFADLKPEKSEKKTTENDVLFDIGDWSIDLDFLSEDANPKPSGTTQKGKVSHVQKAPANLPVPKIFSGLPPRAFLDLVQELTFWEVQDGEYIVTQGEYGESFFIISHGTVHVERKDDEGNTRILTHFSEGEIFGEIAILVRNQRSASVVADGYVEVLEIPREVTDKLMRTYPETREAVALFSRERVAVSVLKGNEIFASLDDKTLYDVAASFTSLNYAQGQKVITQGQKGPGLFMLLSGKVTVNIDGNDVGELQAGDVFGEMSIYFGGPANATITPKVNCQFLHLPTTTFVQWRKTHPALQKALARLSKERELANRRRAQMKQTPL